MTHLDAPAVAAVLDREHAAARAQRAERGRAANRTASGTAPVDFRTSDRHRTAYLAIGPDQGRWLYGVVLATGAREIVEFGSSFGISTIYLAAAAAETGGRVTGTEFHAPKADKARANLGDAGLTAEILQGDALDTLAGDGPDIDLLFLDGAKDLYLPVLRLLEPRLRKGSVVIADNIPLDRETDFIKAVSASGGGYVTTVMQFGKGGMSHSVRLT
ncbi:O-methyltransferase [Marinibacterium sp. SX1]|uniref:O-methyltransferase n=1 Tax=Marinibacterium sp. SX1 TaxID=3388424 RepID=UPI003D16BCF7